MVKETKYFMSGTDEEVLLGDVISQELVKDFEDGRKLFRKVKFELTEETLPYALKLGIIEEAENEEEEEESNDLIDFEEGDCPFQEEINGIIETQEDHDKRIEVLEERVVLLKTFIDSLNKKSVKDKKQPKPEQK